MSILSSVTNLLDVKVPGFGLPSETCKPEKQECDSRPQQDCKPEKQDDCTDSRQSNYNNDQQGRDGAPKYGKDDDHSRYDNGDSKYAKNDDHSRYDNGDSKYAKNDDHSRYDNSDSKYAKNDDHSRYDNGDSKYAKNDDHCDEDSKHGKNDDHSKNDHSKYANNDDCQPQKDYCEPKPSDDCGKVDNCHSPGEALANLDFSHGNFGSAPDHSDTQAALASMSSGHALDYAIGQLGPADHFDMGHFDIPADTSHDMGHHA
jgi:hypothetical protein